MFIAKIDYSCVPIKRAGPIKQAGRNFLSNFKNKQALLSQQDGISVKFKKRADIIKHAGRNFYGSIREE